MKHRHTLPRLALLLALVAGPVACRTEPTATSAPAAPTPRPTEEPAEDPVAREAQAFTERVAQQLQDGQVRHPPTSPEADRGNTQSPIRGSIPPLTEPAKANRAAANQPGSVRATRPQEQPANLVERRPPSPSTAEPNPPTAASTGSADTVEPQAAPVPPEQLARQLHERLLAAAQTEPGNLKPWLGAMAMSLIDPRLEITAERMPDVSPQRRKLLLAYQRTFTLLGQLTATPGGEGAEHLKLAAEELHEQLIAAETLRIRHPRLCRRVEGYGVYTSFEDHTFLAGREHPVIVYAEIENFATRPGDGDHHIVRLTQEIVLYNKADGLAVWRVEPTQITDRSRNRRRDFFIVQVIHLPAALTVGEYMLKVRVTDEIGNEVDEAMLPMKIVADPTLEREP